MAIQKHPTGARWEEIVNCTDDNKQSQLISSYIADLQLEAKVYRENIQGYTEQIKQLNKEIKALKKTIKDSDKDIVIQMKPKDLLRAMKEYGDNRASEAKAASDKSWAASQYDYVFNGGS